MLTLSALVKQKNNEATKILKEIVENTPSTDAALTARRLKHYRKMIYGYSID